ncbi:MAG: DNA polymerase III subunit delta, partial [Kitasatospora sp.]|nr:DNA polymerase III subunit delta [Kitasatospora sp.]
MNSSSAPGPGPAGVCLVVGEEELLVERAVARLVAEATEAETPAPGQGSGGAAEVRDVPAVRLAPGELAALVSPSLFGGAQAVVIRGIQDAGKDVAAELERYAASPSPDTLVVLTHAGGAKGKTLLTALTRGGAPVIRCPRISRADERMDFVRAEFRALDRKADQGGVRALIDAVGTDLSELAAACAQLAEDVPGRIDRPAVARYYRGRAEASGFSVADRAVEGRLGDALEQLRWALATGVAPVLISSALAQGVRALGKVGAVPRGRSSEALAGELGLPPWKIDRVRRQLNGWSPDGVARALQAVAE